MDSSHDAGPGTQSIELDGSASDPGHADHRWELDVRPDLEGRPYIAVAVTSGDHTGLAMLTAEQARLVARTLVECAGWIEAAG